MKRILFVPLAIIVLAVSVVLGQGGLETFVNYFETTEGDDAFQLDVYFNLVDGSGQVVPSANAESLEIQLQDGSQYAASVIRPEVPFYIAIVLDASGSMTPANADMRSAAISAVESAPDFAQFSVISFSENVEVQQAFTSDRGLTSNNIDQVRSRPNGWTCLYDAANVALQEIARQPQGRRAVILFTDGVDEIDDGQPCSTTTLPQLLQTAINPELRIPIYVVGMEGQGGGTGTNQINQGELSQIADETGGFVAFGSQSDLNSLFQSMMLALSNQFLGQAQLYPPQGQNIATLTPILEGGVRAQPTTITFNVSGEYAPPFQLFVNGLQRGPNNHIALQVRTVGESRVASASLTVVDENGFTVITQEIGAPIPGQINIDGNQLMPGESYNIILSATNDAGRALLADWEPFKFTMPEAPDQAIEAVNVQILSISPPNDNNEITVQLSTLGAEQFTEVGITLLSGGLTVAGPFTSPPESETITLDISGVPRGADYELRVIPLSANGDPVTDRPATQSFDLPAAPTIVHIEAVEPNEENTQILVDLISRNTETIQSLRVWVVDADTGQRIVPNFEVEGVPDTFNVGIQPKVGENAYNLNIMPLDASGLEVFSEPVRTEFAIIYQLSLLERISGIILNPIVLVLLVGVAVAIFVVLFMGRRNQETVPALPTDPAVRSQLTSVLRSSQKMPRQGGGQENTLTGMLVDDSISSGPRGRRRSEPRGPRQSIDTPKSQQKQPKSHMLTDVDYDFAREAMNVSSGQQQGPLAVLHVVQAETIFNGPIQITRAVTTIGRNQSCDIQFANDRTVSGEHLRLTYEHNLGTFVVHDVSRGGTAINGQYINKSTITLQPGQESVLDLSKRVRLRLIPGRQQEI